MSTINNGMLTQKNPNQTYQEIEKLNEKYKKMAQEKALEEILKSMGEEKLAKTQAQPRILKDIINERIESVERQLGRLKQAKQELDGLTLQESDAAFHAEYGNVLIRRYKIADFTTMGEVKKEWDGSIIAEVITLSGGVVPVLATELVPITEATKVLFGKKT